MVISSLYGPHIIACVTMLGQPPNQITDGLVRDLFPDLDQGIHSDI